ncbi:helix-turn-helix domain-containing protein, partial [Gordonia amicalis]
MLTQGESVEAHALRKQGWTISAIARHLGCNRRTIRNYLNETTTPGVRAKPQVDPFGEFVDYVTARLMEDPHLWARTLCDELEDLGYRQSYQTLTRQIRARDLRPVCTDCATATDRANTVSFATVKGPPGLIVCHRDGTTWIASYGTTGASRWWSFILSVDSAVTMFTPTPIRQEDQAAPPSPPGFRRPADARSPYVICHCYGTAWIATRMGPPWRVIEDA